jgi:hypothetical protein
MSDLFGPIGELITQERRFEGKLRRWRSTRMDLTAKVVCKKCNETWMSDIEERIKTSFSQIIVLGPRVSILQRGASLLAAFAFEKAVIADHLYSREEPFFEFVDRDRFRQSLAVPDGIQMWLAAFHGERGLYRLFFQRDIMFDLHVRAFVEFLTFTYSAGHLVIQLAASRWKDKFNSRPLPRVESDGSFDSAAVQFWPPDGFAVSWPPYQYFNDKTITKFAKRFDNDVLQVRHKKDSARKR